MRHRTETELNSLAEHIRKHAGPVPHDPRPTLIEICENLLWHFDPEHNSGRATIRTNELKAYAQEAIRNAKEAQ